VWRKSEKLYEKDPADWPYPEGSEVLRLEKTGQLKLDGRRWQVSGPLAGERVQLIRIEHRVLVFFCNTLIRQFDLANQGSTMVEPWSAKPKV
ncbi:MAG: IS481 family transposase, partial [Acidobacteriaceae bacterium]